MREDGANAISDHSRRSRLRGAIGPLIGALAVLLGGTLLYRTLSAYDWQQIVDAVSSIPANGLAGAIAFAVLSYFCLSWFDWLALRYVGKPLPYRRAALASFTSLSIGHNIGFAGLSSGAIRYRFYQRWGLSLPEVAKLVVFCGLTVALGLGTVAGLALVVSPDLVSEITGLLTGQIIVVGAGLLAFVTGYLVMAALAKRPLRVWRWRLDMPHPKIAVAQVLIGSFNFLSVAACLHQLVRTVHDISYFDVAGAYVVSNIAGILSHVPGGVGVIETVLTFLLPGVPLIGALVMFRAIYFLLPLCIGLTIFGLSEILLHKDRAKPRSDP